MSPGWIPFKKAISLPVGPLGSTGGGSGLKNDLSLRLSREERHLLSFLFVPPPTAFGPLLSTTTTHRWHQPNTLVAWVAEAFADVHVLKVEYRPGRAAKLKLVLDTEAGIGVDTCSRIHKALRAQLETENALDDNLSVEVTSPGVEWPLTEAWQFPRHVGRKLQVETNDGTTHHGQLLAADANTLTLNLPDPQNAKATRSVELPLAELVTAQVELPF